MKGRAHGARGEGNRGGFTLLEVMVAVSIMAMVLVTLLGLKNRSVEDVMLARHMTVATTLAKTMMADLLVSRSRAVTEDEGPFQDEADSEYTWKKIVATTPFIGILEFRIVVLWKEQGRDESVELVAYE